MRRHPMKRILTSLLAVCVLTFFVSDANAFWGRTTTSYYVAPVYSGSYYTPAYGTYYTPAYSSSYYAPSSYYYGSGSYYTPSYSQSYYAPVYSGSYYTPSYYTVPSGGVYYSAPVMGSYRLGW
jgi:hypothetical protein